MDTETLLAPNTGDVEVGTAFANVSRVRRFVFVLRFLRVVRRHSPRVFLVFRLVAVVVEAEKGKLGLEARRREEARQAREANATRDGGHCARRRGEAYECGVRILGLGC